MSIKINEKALVEASYEFAYIYATLTGFKLPPFIANNLKAILRPTIEKYLEIDNERR